MNPLTGKRAGWLATHWVGWLALLLPFSARAENRLGYKYMDYREAGGRIAVQTQSALYEQDLGPALHLKLMGTTDTITGATPNGQPAPTGSDQVVLTNLHERRKAWNLDLTRNLSAMNVAVGWASSRESDYTSATWSLNTLTDFNQKNTTILAGVSATADRVKVFYQPAWAGKRTLSAIAGVTQLLNARTTLTFNLTAEHVTGYLSDQYKLVQKTNEIAPGFFLPFTYGENRPPVRDKWIALVVLNQAYPEQHGALEASYRFFHDSFGSPAHTLELNWFQHLGENLILQPKFRFYDQGAADFYYYDLDRTAILPAFGPPRTQGPFYSSDYRLSALRSQAYGLKLVWTLQERMQLDADVTRYVMRGKDGLTPQSAYLRATIITAGLTVNW